MKKTTFLLSVALLFFARSPLLARIDLVTLPERDAVQLTIYNSADLTLVRDSRTLTLRRGENSLQFSWANTLIDPTSIELLPKTRADMDIMELSFPPRVKDLGVWRINSRFAGRAPMEINYFTSGISWRAYYIATLSPDEQTMDIEGYVRVTNRSGEDYENAQVRVIVGEINLLEKIADLAGRRHPYGTPVPEPPLIGRPVPPIARRAILSDAVMAMEMAPKEIIKEGVSEYFLYTIEGTENIPDGWSKRLLSFSQEKIPVVNFYKYEEERYGQHVARFLSFVNDREHNMGSEPLPDGLIKVFKTVDHATHHLAYLGQDETQYIPVGEKVDLNMGIARDVAVKAVLMDYKIKNHLFNNPDGNISGWDEELTYEITASNYRPVPVKVEITRNLPHQYWKLQRDGFYGDYKQIDLDTVRFTVEIAPFSFLNFSYTLIQHEGDRRHTK